MPEKRNVPPEVAFQRSRLGALTRDGAPAERIIDARTELEAAKLAEHIRRAVDGMPPLTSEQRARLALLLSGGEPGETTP